MVKFYSGTPGSGKSFHMAMEIWHELLKLRNVISTVNIDAAKISKNGKKKIGDFVFVPIMDLNVEFLYRYAIRNHKKGREGQTLLVIDECQIIFDTRTFQQKDRREWILFFSRHRHLGYNVILISQQDRMIDRQIRGMFEYEFKHRKANNFGIAWILPFTFFVCVQYWYGNRLRIGAEFIRYRKKIAQIYDSYTMFDDYVKEYSEKVSATAEAPAADEEQPPKPATEEAGVGGSPPTTERLTVVERIRKFFTSGFTVARVK
ncbi:MAG: zonular occludens toxin domain-containing protein [Defluviitaleaceae bacterium]|nr:zonular occludens toxin domain-containing protein [Defluviitaleaceae bacterium]